MEIGLLDMEDADVAAEQFRVVQRSGADGSGAAGVDGQVMDFGIAGFDSSARYGNAVRNAAGLEPDIAAVKRHILYGAENLAAAVVDDGA